MMHPGRDRDTGTLRVCQPALSQCLAPWEVALAATYLLRLKYDHDAVTVTLVIMAVLRVVRVLTPSSTSSSPLQVDFKLKSACHRDLPARAIMMRQGSAQLTCMHASIAITLLCFHRISK